MSFTSSPSPAQPYPSPAQPYPPPGWPPATPPPPPPRYQVESRGLALLAFALLIHVAANVYWLHADNHLIHLDEAHHIQRAVAFHEALFSGDAAGIPARVLALLEIESPYPPLSHLLGAAAIEIFGYSPDVVALSGSVSLALLLLGVYVLARQSMSARNAGLACLITSFIPMVYGYARLVMPDTLCGALVVWALVGLVKSDYFSRTGWTAFFGAAMGMALLTKQTAFVYLLLPGVAAAFLGFTRTLVSGDRQAGVEQQHRKQLDLLLNLAICACVVAAVCSWWYLRHADYLYTWWSTQRGLGRNLFQPGIASRLSGALPPIVETPEVRIALDPALSRVAGPEGPVSAAPAFTSLIEPYRLFWRRYLVYLVNEAIFLPLALVALLGVPAALLKRNRTALLPVMLAWPGGAYLVLTGLFALHSPRFVYGALPAIALFAVLGLDSIPVMRLRRAVWAVFLGLLVLQFVNISFVPLGPIKRVEIPVLKEETAVAARGNAGLTLYKDTIETGHYVIHPPHRDRHTTEAALESMVAHENARPEGAGPTAWYQIVSSTPGTQGVHFHARRYAPPPNPFRPVTPEDLPTSKRPFAAVKLPSLTPEGTLPELAETEYVVVQEPFGSNAIPSLETTAAFFAVHGFESIFNGKFEGYGPATPAHVHVLARKAFPAAEQIDNLFDAYDMLELDGRNYLLEEEARKALEQRYAREVGRYTDIRPLTSNTNLLGFHVKAAAQDWFVVRLVVHAADTPRKDMRVWLRAEAHPDDRAGLLEAHQNDSPLVWDFSPEPPAQQWKKNQALVLSHPVMARPLRYQMEIGLYDPETEAHPRTRVETEWIDFSGAD